MLTVYKWFPNIVVFLAGVSIMVLELVAGRYLARHIGSSLDTWTAVIGVILTGMSLGNYLGGKLTDRYDHRRLAPWLFAAAGVFCAASLLLNDAVANTSLFRTLPHLARILLLTFVVFSLPSVTLGMIPPVVAQWALAQFKHAGTAIGSVYAWGTAGNIIGTFVTGFYLFANFGVQSILVTVSGLLLASGLVVWLLIRATPPKQFIHQSPPELARPGLMARLAPNAYVFLTGFSIMALELVCSRLVSRHLGTSIYTWTSLIGIVLAGITLGNLLGGLLAARFTPEKTLPYLFVWASMMACTMLWTDVFLEYPEMDMLGNNDPRKPIFEFRLWLSELALPERVLGAVLLIVFLPCTFLGTVSPVAARLALDRAKAAGTAIGNVYAWGAIGSIAGTFLTGYVLLSQLGPSSAICLVAIALSATAVAMPKSNTVHAVWTGVVLALTITVAAPSSIRWASNVGDLVGVRDDLEKDFLFDFEPGELLEQERESLDKGIVSELLRQTFREKGISLPAQLNVHTVLAGASWELVGDQPDKQFLLEHQNVDLSDLDESLDPTVGGSIFVYWRTYIRESNYYRVKVETTLSDGQETRELVLDNLIHGYVIRDNPMQLDYDYELIYASIMERAGAMPKTDEFPASKSLRTLYIGGGSYTFPRFVEAAYPGSSMLVLEIDPAVTTAAHEALFLRPDTPIETVWGDARMAIEGMATQGDRPEFDFIYGDAFNDFSVPWHLTTKQFNERVEQILAPNGVYMINIIDNFQYSRFLGAFIHTARQVFDNVAVFATDYVLTASPYTWYFPAPNSLGGSACSLFPMFGELEDMRDTFVIAMSNAETDWRDLGYLPGEREFFGFLLPEFYKESAVGKAGRVLLTDDFAPVENFLAKVAQDRD